VRRGEARLGFGLLVLHVRGRGLEELYKSQVKVLYVINPHSQLQLLGNTFNTADGETER